MGSVNLEIGYFESITDAWSWNCAAVIFKMLGTSDKGPTCLKPFCDIEQ